MPTFNVRDKKFVDRFSIEYGRLTRSTTGPPGGILGRELAERLLESQEETSLSESQFEYCQRRASKCEDVVFYEDDLVNMSTSPRAQSSRTRAIVQTMALAVVTPRQAGAIDNYLQKFNCCPPPVFILLTSVLQVAIFCYYYETQSDGQSITTYCAGCHDRENGPGPLIFVPRLRAQIYRFMTYMLLHAGIFHLTANLLIQLMIGIPLELVHKVWRIAPLYLLAGILGALVQYAFDPSVLLVGASAGVYALITAHLSNLVLNWSQMPYRWLRLGILTSWFIFDVGETVYRRLHQEPCGTVSHLAHLAGGITGLLFGFFVLYNVAVEVWEKYAQWVCFALYTCLFAIAIGFAIFRQPTDSPFISDNDCDFGE